MELDGMFSFTVLRTAFHSTFIDNNVLWLQMFPMIFFNIELKLFIKGNTYAIIHTAPQLLMMVLQLSFMYLNRHLREQLKDLLLMTAHNNNLLKAELSAGVDLPDVVVMKRHYWHTDHNQCNQCYGLVKILM